MTESHPDPSTRPDVARSLINLQHSPYRLARSRLWLQVLLGMALGIGTGLALGPDIDVVAPEAAAAIGEWLALPGNLFLAAIKFVVVPLVAASVIRGIAAGQDIATLRAIGLRIVIYFLLTTIVAVSIGSALAYVIAPGGYVDKALVQSAMANAPDLNALAATTRESTIPQRIVALLPTNPYRTLVDGDMLQIVIASAIIGVAMLTIGQSQSKIFLDLMGSLQSACMVIVTWVMRFAPIAVFGLIAQITARIGLDAILGMGMYVITVLVGLLCLLAFYLIIVTVVAGRRPVAFLAAVRETILLAFSTSSSAAVMPLTLKTAEEKLNVRPAVSRFVVPLGTTINMDGTALYQATAAIFLAQVFGIEIGATGVLLILVTAIGASIGTPGTPGVGIVILATILMSVGVPAAGIALILGVDRLLDMSRTAINVTGDLTACVVMDRLMGKRLPALSRPAGEGADS